MATTFATPTSVTLFPAERVARPTVGGTSTDLTNWQTFFDNLPPQDQAAQRVIFTERADADIAAKLTTFHGSGTFGLVPPPR